MNLLSSLIIITLYYYIYIIKLNFFSIQCILDFKCNSSFMTSKSTEIIVPTTTYSSKKIFYSQSGKLNQRNYEGYYAATDILTVRQ